MANQAEDHEEKRKLRVLIVTMGGARQKYMEELFSHPKMAQDFEPPTFSPGVPSRSLRNRYEFLRIARDARLIPDHEWEALEVAMKNPLYEQFPDRFFECLDNVPVLPGRQGSRYDVVLHYSIELWRKAKTINRGRSVFGCTLAHLIAMKRFTREDFDVVLEDNVRMPVEDCAGRIWETLKASKEWSHNEGKQCHFCYFGWLGSIPNIRWMYERHIPNKKAQRCSNGAKSDLITVFPFPLTKDIERDLASEETVLADDDDEAEDEIATDSKNSHRKPGGNPVWGSYGYWISKEGYERLLEVLRNDVGSMLWKGKRARYYSVKPVDKMLPRQIMSLFGQSSVQLATHPAFYRAPMLTSKIHTQWDPEFCKSTEYQLSRAGLTWSDLLLTETEQAIVSHRETRGEWITPSQFQDLEKLAK